MQFTCESHTPQPFMLCYCSICRKTDGGGGYAINLGADMSTLKVEDPDGAIAVYRAEIRDDGLGGTWNPPLSRGARRAVMFSF